MSAIGHLGTHDEVQHSGDCRTVERHVYRPFCKWICPLGALFSCSIASRILQYQGWQKTCELKRCARTCKMDVDITKGANAALECIRCGECIRYVLFMRLMQKLLVINKESEQSGKGSYSKALG